MRKHGSATKYSARVVAVGHEVRRRRPGWPHVRRWPGWGCLSTEVDRSQQSHTRRRSAHHSNAFRTQRILNNNPITQSITLLKQCDVAMLTVDDDDFWGDVHALDIDGLPPMQVRR